MTWYAAYKLFYSSSIWRIWIIFAPLPLLSYASPYFHIKYAHKCFIDFTPIHISSTSANFVNGLNACLPVWMCWCLPFRLHCLLRRQMTSFEGYASTECEQRLQKHIPKKGGWYKLINSIAWSSRFHIEDCGMSEAEDKSPTHCLRSRKPATGILCITNSWTIKTPFSIKARLSLWGKANLDFSLQLRLLRTSLTFNTVARCSENQQSVWRFWIIGICKRHWAKYLL